MKNDIVKILSSFAQCNAEIDFVELLEKHQETMKDDDFLKFIAEQDYRFNEQCGKLLLFFSIKQKNIKLFDYLVNHLKELNKVP